MDVRNLAAMKIYVILRESADQEHAAVEAWSDAATAEERARILEAQAAEHHAAYEQQATLFRKHLGAFMANPSTEALKRAWAVWRGMTDDEQKQYPMLKPQHTESDLYVAWVRKFWDEHPRLEKPPHSFTIRELELDQPSTNI